MGAALAAVVAAAPAAAVQVALNAATPTVLPGGSVTLAALKTSASGEQAASLSLDLHYDATRFAAPSSCLLVGGAASSKTLAVGIPASGLVRLGVIGLNRTVIPDGAFALCSFQARPGAPFGAARFSVSLGAATPSGTTLAATGGFADVVVGSDVDGDQVLDGSDNCPHARNADQVDRGGIGAGSGPDGIGDACQCGDVSGDGRVTVADSLIVRRSLLSPPTATPARPQLCDVGGASGCSVGDALILSRALLNPPTARIAQVCPPARP